eukprot:227058-Amphidinium_carterae.1
MGLRSHVTPVVVKGWQPTSSRAFAAKGPFCRLRCHDAALQAVGGTRLRANRKTHPPAGPIPIRALSKTAPSCLDL